MRTIVMAAQKGGAGKTTLAIHFATLASRANNPALLIDADPQGSATHWHSRRGNGNPEVLPAKPNAVPRIVNEAKKAGTGLCIIDTAPHDVGVDNLMRVADLIVIPTRPGPLDLAAVERTIQVAKSVKRPFVCIINAGPPIRIDDEPAPVAGARQVLEELGAPVLTGYVAQRAALAYSLTNGGAINEYDPDGQAAQEISYCWRAINRVLKSMH